MRKFVYAAAAVAVFLTALYAASLTGQSNPTLMNNILAQYKNTGATNAVTAVYLDFRILDTLLEAFLLLVSVIGIGQFLRLEDVERVHLDDEGELFPVSPVVSATIRLLLPVLLIYGIYVIAFGATSPGGGFQGGAILATVVMLSYLSQHELHFTFGHLEHAEELLFVLFLCTVGLYFAFYNAFDSLHVRFGYLTACGFIVAFKVAIGLSVVFIRFMGGSEHRTMGGGYE